MNNSKRHILKAENLKFLPDSWFLRLKFKKCMGKKLNLNSPKTFNEKLQWLKLHDRNSVYTIMVDKYATKKYVADRIGEEYIIPTLGVWSRFKDINFDKLPDQFVLKCTHDSGGLVIVKDKRTFDKKQAEEKINQCLKRNFYWTGIEWPYKNVKPRIIAETYMEDSETSEMRDYKFFTFNGKAKALVIVTERQKGAGIKLDFFDMNYHHLPIRNGHLNAKIPPRKPQTFEKMRALAEKLSEGIPQLRVDFYEVNGKIYFGELTFYHWSGIVPFEPEEWDKTFGSWIELPHK
jgi:hypothetical protein